MPRGVGGRNAMKYVSLMIVAMMLAGCGDKVPESKAAKDLGNIPKQTMDRASTGVDSAIQQGVDRMKEEDKKQ
jgi:hypothetical protein